MSGWNSCRQLLGSWPATRALLLAAALLVGLHLLAVSMQHMQDLSTRQYLTADRREKNQPDASFDTEPTTAFLPEPPENATLLRNLLYNYVENPEVWCRKLSMFGGRTLVRRGIIDGDKFVCLDEERAPQPGNCLVYSLGINNEWSFDKAMIEYGCEVFAFDPSMKDFKTGVTDFGVHFYQIGLAGKSGYDAKREWKLMNLKDIRAMLGHENRVIDYLKMDIEGGEWEWLENEPHALENVTQLGMEIHMAMGEVKKSGRRYYDIFKSLQKQGFRLIHSNANRAQRKSLNFEGIARKVATLYELVWIKI